MKRIGIIGGLSPASTLYYYRKFIELSRERFEAGFYPEILIYSLNYRDFSENPEGWEGRKKMLIDAGKRLAAGGAEILGISANTPHIVFPEVSSSVGGEWVSIIDSVGSEAERRGLRRLLLLGTKTTMSMPFYREGLEGKGLDVLLPTENEMNEVNRIITEELMFDDLRSREYLIRLIERYPEADGVILGCTEIPLAIKQGDVPVEVLDSADIHMRALLTASGEPGTDSRPQI